MSSPDVLRNKIRNLEGEDYGSYQALLGTFEFPDYTLIIHQIPKDPYAPSHTGIYRIRVRRDHSRVLNAKTGTKARQVALRDFLARRFFLASRDLSAEGRGTGNSGKITIHQPGQTILERSSVVLEKDIIEVRCFLGLPARGRIIQAKTAETMIFEELPAIVDRSLFRHGEDAQKLEDHLATHENAGFLREQLPARRLVAFIANGARLPRASGTSDEPLQSDTVVPFMAPPSMEVELRLPDGQTIQGMGISEGITLIVGGGYHGKSTLLKAIESGVYNHVSGDGRERCVTIEAAVKVRSYSGRYVVKTDISPFIRNLPFQKDTSEFSTVNASGSTSQAASVMEAVEMGVQALLMDEDTCATNFMVRDRKMQELVRKEDEPITTFIDRVSFFYEKNRISTILVSGGVGDYFDVADRIVQMKAYRPMDVTVRGKEIAGKSTHRVSEDQDHAIRKTKRYPVGNSINSKNHYGKQRITASDLHRLHFGEQIVDLSDLEQLIEISQTKAIGFAMEYARRLADGKIALKDLVNRVMDDVEEQGLDVLSDRLSGDFSKFRHFELAFALNRLRTFEVIQERE
ncbi:MAG: ABC-ATPase domain-containing protein [Bacteroidetes bacterium]|nr:ABC-ATPase domain-containing protein [Bacteroidota bacterium]